MSENFLPFKNSKKREGILNFSNQLLSISCHHHNQVLQTPGSSSYKMATIRAKHRWKNKMKYLARLKANSVNCT